MEDFRKISATHRTKMWHEARKQERKIRGIMVDYKKRAERRREFYEKIKQDPTQFLRLHGMPCKINLDPAVAIAAEGPGTMMPWQGDSSNMIDRFDARAHLDYIPEVSVVDSVTNKPTDREEHKCNYERYRTLVQNDCAGITEEQCLQQISVDEMYPELALQKKIKEEKEKLMGKKAAIGFIYDEKSAEVDEEDEAEEKKKAELAELFADSDSDSDDSLSDLDIDINVDVDTLDDEQRGSMNACAEKFGMAPGEYVRMLEKDKEEVEMLKRAKEEEEEKAMYSGRKSRRERRAFIEKKLRERRDTQPSPPSYARRNSPTYQPYQRRSRSQSSSRSRSTTPEDTGRVTFITSFGEDEASRDSTNATPTTLTSPLKSSQPQSWKPKRTRSNSSSSTSSSRSHSRSRSRDGKSKSRSPDGSRLDRGGRFGRSRSRSTSSSRSRSGSRSKSKSPTRRSHTRSRSSSRSRSRSPADRHRNSTSPGRYRARSKSRSPDRRSNVIGGSQYNINAKLKKPELGFAKAVGAADKPKLTPQQRLKLRMQKALTKQHKADKVKEKEKKQERRQERQEREDDIREMARKMRRREREKREREKEERERERRRNDRSRSRSSSPERRRRHGRRYSRSRSQSRSRSPRSRSRSISPSPHSRYHERY